MTDTTKDFERWARLGFGPWLLPIIPPLVALTPQTQIKPEARGKAVGLRGVSGQWYGYGGWHGKVATAEDRAAWGAMGAGVGIQCGVVIVVDIDVLVDLASQAIDAVVLGVLGAGVPRVGRAPKVLRVYVAAPGQVITKRRLAFRLPGRDDVQAVEVLGEGQQFVATGTHPGTMRPYAWPDGEPLLIELMPVTAAAVDAMLDAVEDAVRELGGEVVGRVDGADGERGRVDQAALAAPSEELLAEALARVPNGGDRDAWIRMGHAIKAAGGTEEQWAEWSDRWDGPAEDPEDIARRWAGFRPPFAAGWPHIERAAREAGWYGGVEAEFRAAGLDLAAMAKAAEAAKPPPWEEPGITAQERMFRRYVWVEAVERIGDMADKALLSKVQFNARLAEIGAPHDTRNSAWAQFFEAKHGAVRCLRVADVTYRPGEAAIVAEGQRGLCFNTWLPSALKPLRGATDADVALWLGLVERVVPDARQRGILLDWLAGLIQMPGKKPAFVLVFGGHEGIGKDSILAPVVRALGQHNVQNIPMRTVMGPQTHWVANCQLVIITEMHSFTRREVMEALKPIGAAPPDVLEVNKKYLPQYTVPNIVAGCYFTNHLDALALSDSDRRHFIVWSPHENPEAMEPAAKDAFEGWFKQTYYPWLDKQGGAAAVAGWLAQRDLTAFRRLARAPWTPAKDIMRREGRSEAQAAIEDALDDMGLPDLVNPEDLAVRLNAGVGRTGKGVTGHAIGKVLRARGWEPLTTDAVAVPPTALVTPAKRIRIWAAKGVSDYRGLRPAALARKFAEMWGATKQDTDAFFSGSVSTVPLENSTLGGESVEAKK